MNKKNNQNEKPKQFKPPKDKKTSIGPKPPSTKPTDLPNSTIKTRKSLQEPITSPPVPCTTPSLKEQLDNLQSIFCNLALLDQRIDRTFNMQREYAESKLHEKLLKIIELKENNFKLFSKLNSMVNINSIDEYFSINYPRILQVCPKAGNVIESMNDFVENINYGIDRLYLDDYLICDEASLRNSLQSTTKEIEALNTRLAVKKSHITSMKENYSQLLSLILNEKASCTTVKADLDKYKLRFLGSNIASIYQELVKENLFLMNSLINDD